MTGRIEQQLKDIHGNIVANVKNWMVANQSVLKAYSVTLHQYGVDHIAFENELISQAIAVVNRSSTDDAGGNLRSFLSGHLTSDLVPAPNGIGALVIEVASSVYNKRIKGVIVEPSDLTIEKRVRHQVKGILEDSAIPHADQVLNHVVKTICDSGVTTPRGVGLAVRAFFTADPKANVYHIEAVLWELVSDGLQLEYNGLTDPDTIAQQLANLKQFQYSEGVNIVNIRPLVIKATMDPKPKVDTKPKVAMLELNEHFYRTVCNDDELVISREYGIHPVSEMPMQGAWVLRNYHTGEFIDSDRYWNDLTERHNLEVAVK
ncbi:hypothetical protein ST201phi2-1p175 [Pseudomonas phage 201phi2-1]|uniref:Uncharacterized protein n=1 Tax=Pseudomonas phage 201phi2-1 TaxID=198110 RepID=B3FJ38_BP201|nr:hypothetical protein ST201phi2-1p175 [Pseudomonas phage 201phi2-1]ABY63005.1 hypothetical protein 201phi2-1p175 [Pseudomonas phage 201phi2-1]